MFVISSTLDASAKGAFHLSELTGQTIPVVMRILLLIKIFQPDPSNPKYHARRRWFSAKTVGKSLFHCKNAAPAMVWPASSDFWKAPVKFFVLHSATPKFLEIRVGKYCLCYSSLFVRSTVVPF